MAALITVLAMLISFFMPSMAVVAMSPPTGCTTRELLLLSPCLPFISAPPNNISDTVSSECCEAFSSGYDSGPGDGICLCYFLREPQILGFPLNRTKLIALSSFCPLIGDDGLYLEKNSSLDSICADSQTLPPLQSSRIPRIQEPDTPDENTPAPDIGIPPSATVSPSAPADEMRPSPSSATAKRFSLGRDCIGLFLSGSLFLIHISPILEQFF